MIGEIFAPQLAHLIAPGFAPGRARAADFLHAADASVHSSASTKRRQHSGALCSTPSGRFLIPTLAPVDYNAMIVLGGILLAGRALVSDGLRPSACWRERFPGQFPFAGLPAPTRLARDSGPISIYAIRDSRSFCAFPHSHHAGAVSGFHRRLDHPLVWFLLAARFDHMAQLWKDADARAARCCGTGRQVCVITLRIPCAALL